MPLSLWGLVQITHRKAGHIVDQHILLILGGHIGIQHWPVTTIEFAVFQRIDNPLHLTALAQPEGVGPAQPGKFHVIVAADNGGLRVAIRIADRAADQLLEIQGQVGDGALVALHDAGVGIELLPALQGRAKKTGHPDVDKGKNGDGDNHLQ